MSSVRDKFQLNASVHNQGSCGCASARAHVQEAQNELQGAGKGELRPSTAVQTRHTESSNNSASHVRTKLFI